MDLNNIPIMAALKKRMGWLNANQKVISQNVAQADTPNYKAVELKEQNFAGLVDQASGGRPSVTMRTTKAGHMGGTSDNATLRAEKIKGNEESPSGNSVVLEEEMLKLADNQMQYGLVTNLYKKNLGLLKAAMGKKG